MIIGGAPELLIVRIPGVNRGKPVRMPLPGDLVGLDEIPVGWPGLDTLDGGRTDTDALVGGSRADPLAGADDVLDGSDNPDELRGGGDDAIVVGEADNDLIQGDTFDDPDAIDVGGATGEDAPSESDDPDPLFGDSDDTLLGSDSPDELLCGRAVTISEFTVHMGIDRPGHYEVGRWQMRLGDGTRIDITDQVISALGGDTFRVPRPPRTNIIGTACDE